MNARYGLIAVLFSASLVLSGCSDSHEKVSNDLLRTLEEVPKLLAEVKDEKSAKVAASKLAKLGERIETIKNRMKDLGDPPKEEEKRRKDRIEKIGSDVGMQMMRIMADPKMMEPVAKAMQELPEPPK